MLKNFVLETANAPGTSTTFNLGGAATDRFSFAGAGFTNGQVCFYFMDDGAQFEYGVATFNTGSPNTLSRTTVLGNSAGNTSRLNFTGTTDVYNAMPAENAVYRNSSNVLDVGTPGSVTASGKTLFRGHLNGLVTSRNAGTPNTKIDVSIGAAMDEVAQAGFITSSSVITIDAGTAGANGLDTGSLAASTWYHVHVIGKTDGTVAGFMSTSLTPSLPSGYSLRRRIGSVKTDGSSHFLAYTQFGDEFRWGTASIDLSASVSTPQTVVLAVPPGVRVTARNRMSAGSAAGPWYVIVYSLIEATTGFTTGNDSLSNSANNTAAGEFSTLTDTSGQIGIAPNGTITIKAATFGWIDSRGKLS